MKNYFRGIVTALIAFVGFAAHAEGDVERGKGLVVTCVACHGEDGATGLDGTYPNIAGQNAKYLERQMQAIKDGSRQIPLMIGQLDNMSDQDLADIAAYYQSLPGKVRQASGDDEQIAQAADIYRGGIARKGVAACSACHNPSGLGNEFAGFPRISGQPAEYTIAQLTAYRERTRQTNEVYGAMMRDIAEGLTDTEIAMLADYLQGLN